MTRHDLTLLDRLADVPQGGPLDRALRRRAEARQGAEDSYRLLLHPADPGPVTLAERRAIAAFTAVLLDEDRISAHFIELLRATYDDKNLTDQLISEAENAAHPGPYGRFEPGPLSIEDLDGPTYRAPDALRAAWGDRLAAALEHAHLVALHPRDAEAQDLDRLRAAGWEDAGIVVLTQIVGLVGFQARIVAGLRAYLALRPPHASAAA